MQSDLIGAAMKHNDSIGGLRLDKTATAVLRKWVTQTGKSANWLASWAVAAFAVSMFSTRSTQQFREELETMSRVQSELNLFKQKHGNARKRLQQLRARNAQEVEKCVPLNVTRTRTTKGAGRSLGQARLISTSSSAGVSTLQNTVASDQQTENTLPNVG